MEEQPERALSNSDIDEVKFYAHWRGYEEEARAAIRLKKTHKKKIKIKDPTRGKLGVFNPKDGDGTGLVTSFFVDGQLKMSYSAFILRLRNNDNFEQKPLEYYQQLPSRNGVKIDNPKEQQFMTIYHNLADGVGSKPETLGEEKYLIQKKKKCWCCSLN